MREASARGVIYVHSAPAALCPHAEWALSSVLGNRVTLAWTPQPAAPGQLRSEVSWTGEPGTAGKLATALKAWPMLRFEITEEASAGVDGERICHLPGRGIWRSTMSANGDVMIGEEQLRNLLGKETSLDGLRHAVATLVGVEFDEELEAFRRAGEGTPVTWLHQVG